MIHGIIDLRKALYYQFSEFGKVLDVVALKTTKMRGQAFIVFEDITQAALAKKRLEGKLFLSKPLSIQYAKSTSKATIISSGSYTM